MSLQTEKLDIIEQLIQVQDEKLLLVIKSMLDFGLKHQQQQEKPDFWEELTEAQRSRIDRAIEELESGQGISHEEVMTRFRKKYKA